MLLHLLKELYLQISAAVCKASVPQGLYSKRLNAHTHVLLHCIAHKVMITLHSTLLAGKPYWQRARVADKIHLRIGSAADSLAKLLEVSINHQQ